MAVPPHHFLYFLVSKEIAFWQCAQNIIVDEFEYFLLLGILFQTRVIDIGIDHNEVLLAFADESRYLVLTIGGHIFK